MINAGSLAICGLLSSLMAGIIADKFGKNDPTLMSKICVLSAIVAFPLTAAACLIRNNFWLAMALMIIKALISSSYVSPSVTMMQNTTKAKDQGNIMGAHMFYTTITSTAAPLFVSMIINGLGATNNPVFLGQVLSVFSLVGYWGSIPFFYLAGKNYKKYVEENKKQFEGTYTFN